MELVAVGIAGFVGLLAAHKYIHKKLLGPKVPVWDGPKDNAIIAHLNWHEEGIPAHFKHCDLAFQAAVEYPFPRALFKDQITFKYALPIGQERGVLYRVSGGDHAEWPKCEYILYEVAQLTAQLYTPKVRLVQKAGREARLAHEKANLDIEAFYAKFKSDVAADTWAVITTIRAGGQAELRDWLTCSNPPAALLNELKGVVADAARLVGKARRTQEAEAEKAARALERERADREREQRELVYQAECKVAAEREEARQRLFSKPIPFAGLETNSIVFGTNVKTGQPYNVDLRKLRHILLCGVSGAGKSVLLHLLVHQMVAMPEFEKVIVIDLKGGIEFARYRNSGKVEVVWDFDNGDVARAIEGLMRLAEERQTYMRENGLQNWPMNQRVALVIDEFAEVQSAIDAASEREEKARAKRLASNLVSLARRARALGIHIVIAVQKPTTDAIGSSLVQNLTWRMVMRQGATHTARALLDIGDDFDRLPVSPTRLPTGRFYAYDTSNGGLILLQAQIAPGMNLD